MSYQRHVRRSSILATLLLVMLGTWFTGCSPQQPQEEVAMSPAPPQPAQPTEPMVDSSGDTSTTDTGDGTDTSAGDIVSEMTDDPNQAADGTTAMTEPQGAVMLDENGEVMTDEDGNPMRQTIVQNVGQNVGQNIVLPKPKTLREQAEQAFASGQEKAAVRLIQAHLLANTADAPEILSQYRWSPMRKQPQLLARVAVGVDLENSEPRLKAYGPIGSIKKPKSSRSNRNPEPQADFLESESPAATFTYNEKERILQKFAGMMGDSLVKHVRETHEQGLWSPYFKSNAGVSATAGMAQTNDFGDATSGDDGSSDGNAPMAMISNQKATPLATKIVGPESKYISLGPSLSYIGVAKAAKLHDYAKEGGFDALIVFDVKIDLNLKVRLIYNTCQAKLFTVGDTKPIAVSKTLKNTDAQVEIDKTGMAYVDKSMQALNAALDARVALTDIPGGLTSELIKTKRLPIILADTSRSKLEILSEVRFYREKGFLKDEEVATAFTTVLGADASKKLLEGSDAERQEVVLKLLDVSAGR